MSRYIEFIAKANVDDIKEPFLSLAKAHRLTRCKDCKHWCSDGGAMMVCEHTDIPTDACDFCSWGEREGE